MFTSYKHIDDMHRNLIYVRPTESRGWVEGRGGEREREGGRDRDRETHREEKENSVI